MSLLRRYPLAIQLRAGVVVSTVLGTMLLDIAFSLNGSCPESVEFICGSLIILAIVYVFASLFLLPELAALAILAGIFHMARHSRLDRSVVVSVVAAAAVLAFLIRFNYPQFAEMAARLTGTFR